MDPTLYRAKELQTPRILAPEIDRDPFWHTPVFDSEFIILQDRRPRRGAGEDYRPLRPWLDPHWDTRNSIDRDSRSVGVCRPSFPRLQVLDLDHDRFPSCVFRRLEERVSSILQFTFDGGIDLPG